MPRKDVAKSAAKYFAATYCAVSAIAIATVFGLVALEEQTAAGHPSTPALVHRTAQQPAPRAPALPTTPPVDETQARQAARLLETDDGAQKVVEAHIAATGARSAACGQAARDGRIDSSARAQWECMLGATDPGRGNRRADRTHADAGDRLGS